MANVVRITGSKRVWVTMNDNHPSNRTEPMNNSSASNAVRTVVKREISRSPFGVFLRKAMSSGCNFVWTFLAIMIIFSNYLGIESSLIDIDVWNLIMSMELFDNDDIVSALISRIVKYLPRGKKFTIIWTFSIHTDTNFFKLAMEFRRDIERNILNALLECALDVPDDISCVIASYSASDYYMKQFFVSPYLWKSKTLIKFLELFGIPFFICEYIKCYPIGGECASLFEYVGGEYETRLLELKSKRLTNKKLYDQQMKELNSEILELVSNPQRTHEEDMQLADLKEEKEASNDVQITLVEDKHIKSFDRYLSFISYQLQLE